MERLFEQFHIYLLTEKMVSPNTIEAYRQDLKHFMDFIAERALSPEEIKPIHLKEFLAVLKREELCARSMARKVSSLKAFFKYLHQYHGFENSAESLIFPKIDQRLPQYLSETDIEALLTAAAADQSLLGLRNRVMLSVLYVSGMRISELTHLSITDIRSDVHILAVKGKGGKGRLIPLPETMIKLMSEYRQAMLDSIRDKHPEVTDMVYLFPVYYAKQIKPMTRQACWAIIKKIWRSTGISKRISPHMLRHSLATHLLAHGADLRSLQMLLGHENLSTVQIYTHLDTSYIRSIYDAKHPRS